MKAAILLAAAAVTSAQRATRPQATLCDVESYWSANGYELINNLWGASTATSGSQCTYLDLATTSSVQWHTTWTWAGAPYNVKSYAYSAPLIRQGRSISSISAMPTTVTWSYTNTLAIRADVAYDFFTAADPNHANSGGDYEIMIWLAQYGSIAPLGSVIAVAFIEGYVWELWSGVNTANNNMKVYTFVPPLQTITTFSGDVKPFFTYLQTNQQFPATTQNLIVFQLGTEVFTGGPATFTVSQFSANVY